MRGRIIQRSTKRRDSWTIIVDSGRDPVTGRRLQHSEAVRGTKRDAERRLSKLLTQMDSGLPINASRVALADYLQSWLTDVVATHTRPRTAEAYTVIVRNHIVPKIGKLQLTQLQPSDVERLESGLLASGLSANTVHHVHVVLSKSIKDALRKGIVHRNVCQLVDPPRPGRYEVRVPDAQAIREILSLAATTSYAALLHFMAYTGVRRGEAIALRWESVDLDRGLVSIVETAQRLPGKGIVFQPTKSAAGRRGIALDSITIDVFRAHKGSQILYQADMEGKYQDHGLVFPGPFGGPVDPSVVTRNFEKLARKSGYAGVRLHDLRHGHAAGLIRAGAHPRVVQERLGHSSAAFTMQVYGHVAAGLQAKAAQDFAALMSE